MPNIAFSDGMFRGDLEGFAREARQKAEVLHQEWQAANDSDVFWQTLTSFVEKGWVCNIVNYLDEQKERLRQWRIAGHPAIANLETLYREAREAAKAAMVSFPSDLERACLESKLPIDRTSREPHYTFQNGFLELDIDSGKQLAQLKDREAKLASIPADIGAITEAVESELSRLFHRPFEGEKFLRKLYSNYLAVIRKKGLKETDNLPIRSITHRLGKNEKGFRTDEFLVDLSKLANEGPLIVDGFKFDLQQTKDTNQGMLLHGVASNGYVGFITFRKV